MVYNYAAHSFHTSHICLRMEMLRGVTFSTTSPTLFGDTSNNCLGIHTSHNALGKQLWDV